MFARIAAALPRGHALPREIWQQRHRSFVALLWAHAFGLLVFGIARGYEVSHVVIEAAAIAAFAVIGSIRWGHRDVAASVVTVGLMSSSAVLVHLSGGAIEAHFHFFVMMTLVPLYQSWAPFGIALAYVVVHHGVVGYLDADSVFSHPAAAAAPFKWALIHGAFILGASFAGLIVWKKNEDLRERLDGLQVLALKQSSARELNDGVVQRLAVAKLASDLGDREAVDRALGESLAAARQIVTELLPEAPEPGDFRRSEELDPRVQKVSSRNRR